MPSNPFSIELADTASELMKGAAGWLLIGLGVGALLTGTGGAVQQAGTTDVIVPLLVIGFAVLFIVSGVVVNPRFRRRLDRRHGLSQFGRIKTVENRTRSAPEEQPEPCVVCNSSSSEGLVRRYRQESVIAGIPLWTISENHNFYCPDCALAELSIDATSSTDESNTTKQRITEAE
jgi:hypothetical protein